MVPIFSRLSELSEFSKKVWTRFWLKRRIRLLNKFLKPEQHPAAFEPVWPVSGTLRPAQKDRSGITTFSRGFGLSPKLFKNIRGQRIIGCKTSVFIGCWPSAAILQSGSCSQIVASSYDRLPQAPAQKSRH